MNFENLPEWALTDEAKVFALGMMFGALVRLTRTGLRWVRRVGSDNIER
ncbi:MAG: hypothetical protein QM715_15530 [Nibricoccus sp.]